jgi:hypothetical protein
MGHVVSSLDIPNMQKKKKPFKNSYFQKLGVVAHAYHSSYGRKSKIGRSCSRLGWAKSKTLFLK